MSKISVTTIAGLTSGGDANKVKIDPSNTLHVPGHAAVGADVVDATRALTVVGASDGSGSSIIVGYNSSLASKFSVRDDGYTTVGNGLNLADGNLSFASGHGIDFSANTQAAGMTSELLDDYEEGTWTPIVGGNATYNNQQGIYTKIGRLCFVRGDININVLGTGSANTLSGLPFSGNYQGTPQGAVNVMYYSNIAQNYLWISGYVLNNNTSLYFTGNNSSATTIQLNSGNVFGNNARVLFSATYTVD